MRSKLFDPSELQKFGQRALPEDPKKTTRLMSHSCGSVSRAVLMVVHADFDLDACLCDREFAG